MIKKIRIPFILICLACLLAGCAAPAVQKSMPPLKPLARQDHPRFSDDTWYDGLEHAVQQSLSYLGRLDPKRSLSFGEDSYSVSHVLRSLEVFSAFVRNRPSGRALNRFIGDHYRVYQSVGDSRPGRVLFTGYYEPLLKGSLEKKAPFLYPLYARPEDLTTIDLGLFDEAWKGRSLVGRIDHQRVVPYPDRKAIEVDRCLEKKAKPLVWLQDPVDAFFLQIQGSGKIYTDEGGPLNLHYHISNGRPYRSIGKLLLDTGKIARSDMSLQSIRAYLKAHPEELNPVLNYNPSYVFFKIETEGPKGFLNEVLTPGRSLALDRRLFPPGALAFIETEKPVIDPGGKIQQWSRFGRFVLNQDTGGAIRGPGRADLFWGNGPYAEIAAGHLQHPGTLYFLILKSGE